MTAQHSDDLTAVLDPNTTYQLPPLILHPFAEPTGPQKITQSSRASLILQGLLPAGDSSADELERALLEGRYSELRMLFYVGRDVRRWMEQCLDSVRRADGFPHSGITARSFASLLIEQTPAPVAEKLKRWGVNDYRAIFSRGLGLNALFGQAPSRESLADEFVREYFRYADQLFSVYQSQDVHHRLSPQQFHFDLYSSGEYSRMLERQWESH